MSYRKTVTFTAKVSDYTDGTVTARVQAENNILSQFVTWLLSMNTSISQLEKVEIGDAKWSGYPLYAVQSGAPSAVSNSVNTWALLSDVYMLGKNKGNFCLAVAVDNHQLSVSPSCSFEYQDALNTYSAKSLSIILEQVRDLKTQSSTNRLNVLGLINLYTFSTLDDELSLSLNYWRGTDSLVFGVVGTTPRVFFSLNAVDASWGAALSNGGACCYSFNEVIQAANETQTLLTNTTGTQIECLAKGYATNCEPFWWGNMHSYTQCCYYSSIIASMPTAIRLHTIGYQSTKQSSVTLIDDMENMEISANRLYCGITHVNLPRISREQLYLRKMYIPNRQTSAPIKLAYTPGMLYQDAVYTVNDKHYVNLQGAWRSLMVEVSDQG